MAAEKPAAREVPEQQDRSIKERKVQLFEEPAPIDSGTLKRFSEYVDSTPAAPLDAAAKGALMGAAAVVVLLFLAALFSMMHARTPRKREATREPERSRVSVAKQLFAERPRANLSESQRWSSAVSGSGDTFQQLHTGAKKS